ncbi:tetratricopeptide repeat protein [Aliikangiella sp. IMCC44653]
MSLFWREFKQRKTFKVATFYAAISWGLIQISDVLIPVMNGPDWLLSSMVLIAFLGFPVALIIGWSIDLKNSKALSATTQTNQSLVARFIELGVISLFGLSAAFIYYNSATEPAIASQQSNQSSLANLNEAIAQSQKTIAVLPFTSFSDSKQDEYFADGLSEELLNVLARHKNLRVVARTSSFQYKNTKLNIRTIAQELGVQYILEGSIRRSGDTIRVTAQLIDAQVDGHIFSQTWDRNLEQIFEVQDEIAGSVFNELKVRLFGETERELADISTKNITAFAEYSRGQAFLRNRVKGDFNEAIQSFKNALESDPEFSDAMAMLAQTYLLQASYGLLDMQQAHQLALPLLQQSLAIAPQSASVHGATGLYHWQLAEYSKAPQQAFDSATFHLAKAIQLNPSLAEPYMWYGSILQSQGNFEEGVKLHAKAYQIDPRAAVVGFNRAQDLVRMGQYKEAMEVFNAVVRNNPNYPNAYTIAGDVSFAVGQLDQAYSMFKRATELSGSQQDWLIYSTKIYIPLGLFELAQNNVNQLKDKAEAMYKEKFDWLQASIWLASNDLASFHSWTQSFNEDEGDWSKLLWRGLAHMQQANWKFAINDLEKALQLAKTKNQHRIDAETIRLQLFIAKSYQQLGEQLDANNYLEAVANELQELTQRGYRNQVITYQESALLALQGKNDAALLKLRNAVQSGFIEFWWAKSDPAFASLKQLPDFKLIEDEYTIKIKVLQTNIESRFGQLASTF